LGGVGGVWGGFIGGSRSVGLIGGLRLVSWFGSRGGRVCRGCGWGSIGGCGWLVIPITITIAIAMVSVATVSTVATETSHISPPEHDNVGVGLVNAVQDGQIGWKVVGA
jgi:hypothetical protein